MKRVRCGSVRSESAAARRRWSTRQPAASWSICTRNAALLVFVCGRCSRLLISRFVHHSGDGIAADWSSGRGKGTTMKRRREGGGGAFDVARTAAAAAATAARVVCVE